MAPERTESAAPRARNVRLAIGALTPLTRQAIESAARLAQLGAGRLDCLFVEDAELFRAAALPLTREFGVVARSPRRFEPPDLERAMRQQAAQVRRLIAQAAQAAHLEWTFEVARGALLDEALRSANPDDLMVVGMSGCEFDAPIAGPVVARPPPRTLLALIESLPGDVALLRAAIHAVPGAALTVWTPGAALHPAGSPDAQWAALERELGRPLTRLETAALVAPESVAEALARLRPRLLALQRVRLAALASEIAFTLRRRSAMLVATPSES